MYGNAEVSECAAHTGVSRYHPSMAVSLTGCSAPPHCMRFERLNDGNVDASQDVRERTSSQRLTVATPQVAQVPATAPEIGSAELILGLL